VPTVDVKTEMKNRVIKKDLVANFIFFLKFPDSVHFHGERLN
jgi:hypothetical protein